MHKETNSNYSYSAHYYITYNASGNNPNVSYATGYNNNADDWFYTAPLSLVGERTYQLSFRYRVDYPSHNQGLEVKIGNYAQASAMSASPLFSSVQINNEVYQHAVIDFTPSASGIYYIGFHCTSHFSYGWGALFVDDISVKNRYSVLSNFTTTVNEQSVLLNWQTEIELNNKEFVVERSLDGVNFSVIGTVASKAVAGNSDTSLSYLFEDNLPINGVSYYRLKQVDKSDDNRYSKVRNAVYLSAKVNAIKSCSADFSSEITA